MPESSLENWEQHWKNETYSKAVEHQELLETVCSLLDVAGKKILEVGGGTGGDSIFLARRGAEVYVLDYSDTALDNIRKNAAIAEVSYIR